MIKTTNKGFAYQITRTSSSSYLVQSKYGRFSINRGSGESWELWEIEEDKTTWKESKTLIKRNNSTYKAMENQMIKFCHARMEKELSVHDINFIKRKPT